MARACVNIAGFLWVLVALIALVPSQAWAAHVRSWGQLGGEGRAFLPDEDRTSQDWNAGMVARLALELRGEQLRFDLRALGRMDLADPARDLITPEDLFLEFDVGFLELSAGVHTITWSATEAFHPADIINARDLDSDPLSPWKLGEPMLRASTRLGQGRLQAMFMPWYTQPRLPSGCSRMASFPAGIEPGPPLHLDAGGALDPRKGGPQAALFLEQHPGNADLGLQLVHHLDRSQPELVWLEEEPRPLYRRVTQVGATWRQALGPALFEVELAQRFFAAPDPSLGLGTLALDDHLLAAGGATLSLTPARRTSSTLVVELQSAFGLEDPQAAGPFQRDALLGYRLACNDPQATQLGLLLVMDLQDPGEQLAFLDLERRVGADWSARARLALVRGDPATTHTLPLDSDHLSLSLSHHF